MPHSEHDPTRCVYCGRKVGTNQHLTLSQYLGATETCHDHRDLPSLEPLDDRYLLTEDGNDGRPAH